MSHFSYVTIEVVVHSKLPPFKVGDTRKRPNNFGTLSDGGVINL